MLRRSFFQVCVLTLLAFGLACSAQQRVNTETTLAQALVSDEQSAQLGEQVHRELEAQGVRYLNNRTVTAYVESVAGKIFDQARRDRSGVEYHVHVIDDPNTVNAFATPGGHLYVYTGTAARGGERGRAGGSARARIGARLRPARRARDGQLLRPAGPRHRCAGKNPSAAKQIAASVLGTGILRAHSRSEEIEADEYGARYISALNYDPDAMISFFRKLQSRESGGRGALAWLSTHPVTEDRINNLQAFIQQNRLGGTVLGAQRHATAQQALNARASR